VSCPVDAIAADGEIKIEINGMVEIHDVHEQHELGVTEGECLKKDENEKEQRKEKPRKLEWWEESDEEDPVEMVYDAMYDGMTYEEHKVTNERCRSSPSLP